MAEDPPVFARPTTAAMAGKQTATLKTMVADEVKEDFARFARLRGYPSDSDCLRELVLTAVYGPDRCRSTSSCGSTCRACSASKRADRMKHPILHVVSVSGGKDSAA